ncbi:MAG: hypothetical protein MRJ66_07620 [Nitrospira sp.]|nr:hypothetical protein [Nitrospira sp.]MDR4468396.1 hypothetical protein [Nitrospira sp.]
MILIRPGTPTAKACGLKDADVRSANVDTWGTPFRPDVVNGLQETKLGTARHRRLSAYCRPRPTLLSMEKQIL